MPKLTLMFDDRELQECGGDQPERAEPAPCVPDAVWRDIDHRQDRVGANHAEGLVRAKSERAHPGVSPEAGHALAKSWSWHGRCWAGGVRITLPLALTAVMGGSLIGAGCTSAAKPHEVTPTLREILAGQAVPSVEPAVWTDLRAFYTQRAEAPAWVNRRRPTEHAEEALRALNTARQHGFDPADYGAHELLAISQAVEGIDKKSPERLQRVAEFDVRMTGALLAFGRDVAMGRSTPKTADGSWKARRTAPDYVSTFSEAIDDPLKWIESMRPPHSFNFATR